MDNMHPQLMIEVATVMHRERIATALAAYDAAASVSRGPTPRAALAMALVAVAARLAPGTVARRADIAA